MTITQTVETFKEYYQNKLCGSLAALTQEQLQGYAEMIQKAVSNSYGILYVFGNGGNYAIARQFEMALQGVFAERNKRVVIHTGIDFHTTQARAVQQCNTAMRKFLSSNWQRSTQAKMIWLSF